MTRFLLAIYGIFGFVAGEPGRGGWFARALQGLVQTIVLLGLAAVAAAVIATITRSMVDDDRVRTAISAMIALPDSEAEDSGRAALLAKLEQELRGNLHLKMHSSEGNVGYSVLVAVGEAAPSSPSTDPCNLRNAAPSNGAVCLFRVEPIIQSSLRYSDFWSILPDWKIVPELLSRNLVEFQFPGTAYSIPQLAIAAARANDPELTFTRARSENVQRLVEELIGDNLFLPNDQEVLWGRRLNGPIQFLTYFLTGVALILILFAWINSVSQNWAVTMVRKVPLTGFRSPDPAPPMVGTADPPSPETAVDDESAEVGAAGQAEVEALPLEQMDDLPTPWNEEFFTDCPLDLSDAHRTAEYYERVSRQIQNDSEFLGVHVDPPVLRFRRAAVRAVANTEDTSILPPFLDAQKNSILAYYDARLSVVRFLLWVIPTVGFIGTIIGVSGALSATIGLQSMRDLVSGFAQSSVSASMGMAFDTTLVALIAAVAVMLAYHIVQGAEERMTVLERNRAEEEVLTVSKSVRKPGGTADLAQQLIMLGVNTEALIRDLQLFQRSGPELAALIRALNERRSELEQIDLDSLFRRQRGRGRAVLAASSLLVVLFILLAYEGYLGEGPRQALGNAANWLGDLL